MYFNYNPADWQTRTPADLRLAVISDTHITHRGEGIERFTRTLEVFSQITPAVDAFLLAGDICYQIDKAGGGVCEVLYEEPYDMFLGAVRRYIKDTPWIYVLGNHEFPQNNNGEEITAAAIALYQSKTAMPERQHRVIKGHHVIAVGGENWTCALRPEDEAWVRAEIEKAVADTPRSPVFVMHHKSVQGTVTGSYGKLFSDDYQAFLSQYPNVINITGDLHTPAQDPRAIYQNGYTAIHTPMNAVGHFCHYLDSVKKQINLPNDGSQALLIEVRGGVTEIHRLDICENREIGAPYLVDLPGILDGTAGWLYGADRCKDAVPPAFPDGARATAEIENGKLCLCFDAAEQTPSGHNQDDRVPAYRVELCRGGEVLATHYIGAPYWRYDAPTQITASLPPCDAADTVKIAPISYFDLFGEPIFLKL